VLENVLVFICETKQSLLYLVTPQPLIIVCMLISRRFHGSRKSHLDKMTLYNVQSASITLRSTFKVFRHLQSLISIDRKGATLDRCCSLLTHRRHMGSNDTLGVKAILSPYALKNYIIGYLSCESPVRSTKEALLRETTSVSSMSPRSWPDPRHRRSMSGPRLRRRMSGATRAHPSSVTERREHFHDIELLQLLVKWLSSDLAQTSTSMASNMTFFLDFVLF
jgi:hypothetical protein